MKIVRLTDEQHATLTKIIQYRIPEVARNWPTAVAEEQALLDALRDARDVRSRVRRRVIEERSH